MKKNKTDITLVVDRSGSMGSIKNDMEGGFKDFLKSQKTLGLETYLTHYEFDTEYNKVIDNKNINDVNAITINPRGGTALIDAVCRSIVETGERLDKLHESEKPETVIFIVVTDGEENSSREYKIEKLKELVELQQSKYNWRFIFLGANIDGFQTGQSYGFVGGSSMTFGTTTDSINATFTSASNMVRSYSLGEDYAFSDKERKEAANGKV